MIAEVRGRLAAKHGDRILVQTPGGVGYEIVVPLGVMERLPAVGADVTVSTELVVREDGWSLYGFSDATERQFFQRLTSVSGVGPRLAVSLMSALGVTRAARAILDRDIAVLSSVSGIGKKTAERLVLELAEKVRDFTTAPEPLSGAAGTARKALEGLGYSAAEADRAVREAVAVHGNGDTADALVRRALVILAQT
ncbi:MAG TPA: Holliday junction branch migration protein RuvA [Gemmatimonadales bacterium]|nr:Holliday junction branch migration protein RuvA [Gemmatimonadales bacterium]